MSLLTTVEAVPSRVLSCLHARLLLSGEQITHDNILQLVWPVSLRSTTGDMGNKVLNAVEASGLMNQAQLGRLEDDARSQRQVLIDTICNPTSGSFDLAKAIAFFLLQAPVNDWGTYDWFRRRIDLNNIGTEVDVRSKEVFEVLEDWLLFFGFARLEPARSQQKRQLVPDPTRFVNSFLDVIAPEADIPIPISSVLEKLILGYPIFPGGSVSSMVLRQSDLLPERHLHWSVSTAFLRLSEEGVIELKFMSDSMPYLFTSEKDATQFTHMLRRQ